MSLPVEDVLKDVDETKHQGAIDNLINMKRNQFETYHNEKVSLESHISEDNKETIEKLEKLYYATSVMLDKWIESALKFCAKNVKDDPLERITKSSGKAPGLKLDRLALPVFRGNIRSFARFIREFENTVCLEFSDPKIQVMYLQNQCLVGPPKELVRNLTTYDEVMNRLKERYGKPSVVIDTVLKDISDLKIKSEDPSGIIAISRSLQMAWDDMTAIGNIDEFCNVITLRTLESKLPERLQMLWAEQKNDAEYNSSKKSMMGLKDFVENHRRIAEEVIAMKGKNTSFDEPSHTRKKYHDGKTNYVGSVNLTEQKRNGCFRCGFNHRVKDCPVPATIKCRKCHRQGHIENACHERTSPHNTQMTDKNTRNEDQNKQNGGFFLGNTNFERNCQVRLPIETINTSEGPCLVLWDSGSMLNLVSQDWVNKSALVGKECELEFKVVDSGVKTIRTHLYDIP